jgi:hypothetical protein
VNNLMAERRHALRVIDACRKVMIADKELGNPQSPLIHQTATDAANRLLNVELRLAEETSNGR